MKKILLLISILLLTGCVVKNEITIDMSLNDGIDIITIGDVHDDTGCILTIDSEVYIMESITNTVNENDLGNYIIKYLYSHDETSYNCYRYVKVIDDIAPIAILNSGIDSVKLGETHIDNGITYSDNFDEVLELLVESNVDTSVVGRYIITYTVTDDSLNEVTIIRVVNVVE